MNDSNQVPPSVELHVPLGLEISAELCPRLRISELLNANVLGEKHQILPGGKLIESLAIFQIEALNDWNGVAHAVGPIAISEASGKLLELRLPEVWLLHQVTHRLSYDRPTSPSRQLMLPGHVLDLGEPQTHLHGAGVELRQHVAQAKQLIVIGQT